MTEYQGRTTVIRPRRGWIPINIRELWRFRELLYIFTWRDITVRYKQAAIGVAWAILQPFLMMVIFSTFFGGLAKVPSDCVPYPIFVFSGLLFWDYFSAALTGASNSLIENENIVKKTYFPRVIPPLSPSITPLVDFSIASVILGVMLAYYRFAPVWLGVLPVPALLLLSILAASRLGALLAGMNVRYPDVRNALPFFVQSLFFLTPVIYPTTIGSASTSGSSR